MAETPLIDAEILFKQPGPPQYLTGPEIVFWENDSRW